MKKITPTDLENISFYQLPKWLMEMFTHNIIGVGGFKTYILMYDRLRISSKNNWIDKDDNVYIKYSYDEIMKDLNCNSKTTVSNNIPKWLMEMFTHNIIGVGGFKTYILMYDRLRISSKNNWIDKDDNVYIKYSYDEIMKDLNCNSKTTVSNNIKELEKLGLIAKIKKFSSSNIYYLTIADTKDYTSTKPHTSKSPKSYTDEILESYTDTSTEGTYSINNNYIKNKSSKNNLSKKNLLDEISPKSYTDEILESYTDTSTEGTYSINNNYIKNKSSKNNLSKKNLLDEIETLDISTSLKEKLSEFVDYRSEIRKPIKSFRVISNLISQLGKRFLDEDHLIGSIDMSISCGYQGIFPTKVASATTKVESYNTMMLKKLEGSDGGKSF